jgi:hypothetical protein
MIIIMTVAIIESGIKNVIMSMNFHPFNDCKVNKDVVLADDWAIEMMKLEWICHNDVTKRSNYVRIPERAHF